MKTLDGITQGSDQWLSIRREHFCASEAAAMLGYDKKMSRTELLRMKSTGIDREFSEWVRENLLEKGHEIEAIARGVAEQIIGEDVYALTGVLDVDGLPLLASFDGVVMDESVIWECKSRNAVLIASLERGELPDSHWPQLEQQLLISGAGKALFTPTDGTEEGTVKFWYASWPERRKQLIAGWQQFKKDLAEYQPAETAPAIVVAPIDDLPALTVELVGQVTSSNLAAFKTAALERIESINTNLQTDEDFAIAKKTVKFLDDGEKKLVLVKQQALSQTKSIDELFRTMDQLREEMKAKRLTLDKLVTKREADVKVEIVNEGRTKLADHMAALNKRLATVQMPPVVADFGAVIKGKRNLASMRDAVATLLANKKIESNEIADRISLNLAALAEHHEYGFLFNDRAQIVLKQADDLAALITLRIDAHKKAKAEELAKIEAAAKVKAEAEARAKIEAENKAAQDAIEKKARDAAATPAPAPEAANTPQPPATLSPVDNTPAVASAALSTKPRVALTPQGPRPTADQILTLIAGTYRVTESRALEWMLDTNWRAVVERRAREAA